MPIFQICEPCTIDYDAVIKSESTAEDSAWLFSKLNITSHWNDWRDITGNGGKSAHVGPGGTGGQTTGDVTQKFMQQIPAEKIKALYKKYELDFLMFEYSVDEFL